MNLSDYGKFKYNNYSYDILGSLLLKITGQNHVQLLKKNISQSQIFSKVSMIITFYLAFTFYSNKRFKIFSSKNY